MGFDDFMKKAKEKDGSIYLTDEEKAARGKGEPSGKAPEIVGPTGKDNPAGKRFIPPKIF